MTIQAYVGLPGSGKSYNAVAQTIIPALRNGRTVVTNIPLNKEEIYKQFPLAKLVDFPIDEVKQDPAKIFEFVTNGCIWVVDELWKLFPAGVNIKNTPAEFKTLLAEHRHRLDENGNAITIVFVTQDLQQIGPFARQLVEETIQHRKLTAVGASGSFKVHIYGGSHTGQNPPKSAEINTLIGRYSPDIFKLYKSHTMSNASEGLVNEKALDSRGVVWKRPSMILGGIGVIGAFWFAASSLGGVVDRHKVDKSPQPQAIGKSSSGSSRGITYARPLWRVSGFIEGSEPIAFLESSDGQVIAIDGNACTRSARRIECMYDGSVVLMAPSKKAPPVVSLNPLERKTAF